MTFREWMRRVDACLDGLCGLYSSDLTDCCYRDWYDDEETPENAARMALRENGFRS